MAARGKQFKAMTEPEDKRQKGTFGSAAMGLSLIRDNFTILTWLCFGAVVQGIFFLIAGRLALTPAVAILLYKTLDAYAQSIGLKPNSYMKGVLPKKFAVVFPDEEGNFGNEPSNQDVTVFLIGIRINHPLGLLAPGVTKLQMPEMIKDLEEHSEEYGFLGMTNWLNASDRTTNSELLQVCYFRNNEGLQKFAHSKLHRDNWDWYNRHIKEIPHISIYHETYHVPKGNWESIYVNSHISGINTTSVKVIDEEGNEKWTHPIVDASKGQLKTSMGRMSRSKGHEHDGYATLVDPYANQ
jgi:hypothetical protein